jgi:hypothetical protein
MIPITAINSTKVKEDVPPDERTQFPKAEGPESALNPTERVLWDSDLFIPRVMDFRRRIILR